MKDQLIKHLKRGWLTPLTALTKLGCMSLSQRCGELRRAGVNVISEWRTTPTGKRIKAYRIL